MSVAFDRLPPGAMLIGQDWISDSSGGVFEHIYPATGKVNATITMAGPEEIDRAVVTAWAAQQIWMKITVDKRRDILLRLADLVEKHMAELVWMTTQDIGIPIGAAGVHPNQLVRFLRYYAGWMDKSFGYTTPVSQSRDVNMIDYEPYGVVAVIVPWNAPLFILGMAVAPALAAGNAVVIKPPELAPLSALRFGELCLEAGLPPGLVNIVPGGPDVGDALVRHKGVRKIHFTGGGSTAKIITRAAADNLTPVATELGGTAATLVFPDIEDIQKTAMMAAISGPLAQSGQHCACAVRLMVHDSIYDEFAAAYVSVIENAKIGDPLAQDTMVGPLVTEGAMQRILSHVDRAVDQKMGTLLTGGQQVSSQMEGELTGGYFVSPAVFGDVDNNSDLAQVETFGPVISLLRFSDTAEAVRMANDTDFGLNAYVHTNDLKTAHGVARSLQSGSVWVNCFSNVAPQSPYGGYKQSGVGRAGGIEGLREFQQAKTIRIGM